MSKKVNDTTPPPAKKTVHSNEAPPAGFAIRYPLLLLVAAVIIVYFPSFSFGLTELDDSIFIRDFHEYNENLQNLVTSFQRGLFDAVKDPYYRPLFMDSVILNYQVSDHGENLFTFHLVNVLLHAGTVVLLYKLFLKLNLKEVHAFILCLLFAVHPVLSQAVAWIPGRNDTLLAIFILSFLIQSINYTNNGKTKHLGLAVLFLLLAFFTKETAVFAAPVAFVMIVFVLSKHWMDKRNLTLYGTWVGCFAIWYIARSMATVQSGITFGAIMHDFIPRMPLIVQYLGKVMLPVNLSVFPMMQDTVIYYGIAAIVLLAALAVTGKQKNAKVLLSGLVIFLLFLLPVLLVPAKLNEQSFEHRLYLPMIGILLMLSQTVLLANNLTDKQLVTGGVAVAIVFAVINFKHQSSFSDPLTFWSKATEDSPHSAYATMMLAARIKDEKESFKLFRKAYQMNPKEKYLNFYYGVMLQKQDSVQQSEKYLLTEKNTSGYYECDFYLARAAMERKDLAGAANYLQTYLKTDPNNQIANNNLLLLYMDTQQMDKARAQVAEMRKHGLAVPQPLLQKLGM